MCNFKMILKTVVICLFCAYKAKGFGQLPHIDYRPNSSWITGTNSYAFSHIKRLLGAKKGISFLPPRSGLDAIRVLPQNFDPREKWPNCPTLNEIRDQGRCGSCWAHATVEVMTDRYCIASKGRKQFHFSAQDVMTCCSNCGEGCNGGDPYTVLEYWKEVGIVSGGNYKSGKGCSPYTIESCDHTFSDPTKPCLPYDNTPICSKTCQGNYSGNYKDDLKRGKDVYNVTGEYNNNMMMELYNRGPIVATIDVYEDFHHYNGTGVYEHDSERLLDQHALKIMGWG